MKTITPRHYRFIDLYCNPDNRDTFGNACQSYIKAGFKRHKGNKSAACRLLSDENIKELVARKNEEFRAIRQKKAEFDEEFIRIEWIELLESCKENNDRTNLNAVLRTMAQHKAMLTDKYKDDTDRQSDYKSLPDDVLEYLQNKAIEATKPNIKLDDTSDKLKDKVG